MQDTMGRILINARCGWINLFLKEGENDMELRQLEIFEAVAETKTFTAAAERLGYVQSSVSTNILTLERELGVPLFDRLGHQVKLTEAGMKFLFYVRQVRQILDVAKGSVTDATPQGHLTVGACESPGTYRLPRLIAKMRNVYPKIDINVRVPLTTEERRDALRKGVIDVALTLDEPDNPEEFESVELRREPIRLVLHPDHPLALLTDLDPFVLAQYPHLATELGGYRSRFESYLDQHHVFGVRVIELRSVELIKQCVMTGLGYGVLPMMTVEQELVQGTLVTKDWPQAPESMSLYLVRYRRRWMPPALKVFWQAVIDWTSSQTQSQSI